MGSKMLRSNGSDRPFTTHGPGSTGEGIVAEQYRVPQPSRRKANEMAIHEDVSWGAPSFQATRVARYTAVDHIAFAKPEDYHIPWDQEVGNAHIAMGYGLYRFLNPVGKVIDKIDESSSCTRGARFDLLQILLNFSQALRCLWHDPPNSLQSANLDDRVDFLSFSLESGSRGSLADASSYRISLPNGKTLVREKPHMTIWSVDLAPVMTSLPPYRSTNTARVDDVLPESARTKKAYAGEKLMIAQVSEVTVKSQ
ncbi:hypothetical protein F5146DRAFT_1145127 [Armillaria mellea]|nr:hypothetical protein F5146DRAFT_1145127 [Armillaria mellea]